MSDGRKKNGGPRRGAGRKPKPIEDAQHSVLLQLFDANAERLIVEAMIAKASIDRDVAAATWLWDRKYGKVKDSIEQHGTIRYIVEYVDPAPVDPAASSPAPDPERGETL